MADSTGSKITVLIVDDIAETRENIRKLLQFEPDIEVVAAARTGREGVALAKQHKPNVALMDINMPDMDGITATDLISKDSPATQIIILSVQSDSDYMRRAMRAGASDFLSKPPSGDELIATIRKVHEVGQQRAAQLMPAPQMMGPGGRPIPFVPLMRRTGSIITVYSPKGGAGCTTLATNLAVLLHGEDSRAVLMDADLQFGNVGVFLNLQSVHTLVDLAERSEDELDADFLNGVLAPHSSGLRVALAPARPELAEEVTGLQLKAVLEALRREFAYVVVDTPSTLNDHTLAVFDMSDRIVLLTTPDIPALYNARMAFEILHVLEFPAEKTLFVVNRVDKRGGIRAADIEESLKHTVIAQVPLDERAILLSINQGVPLVMGDRSRPSAQGIIDLAQKIKAELEVSEADIVPLAGKEKEKADKRLIGRAKRSGA
jgi:pilus assembly protein CpaE